MRYSITVPPFPAFLLTEQRHLQWEIKKLRELKADIENLNTCLFTQCSLELHSKQTETQTKNKFRPLAEMGF